MVHVTTQLSPWKGIVWMLVTGFCFVAVTGIVRYVGSDIPAPQAAFIRYAFGVILMLPALLALMKAPPAPRRLGVFAIRGVAHTLGVTLWFYAMARIPIAEVTAIGYTAPIFVTIGAALFLGEKMALRRILAICVAFAGALVVLRPGFQEISAGQMAQVVSAPLFAISYLMAKQLTRDESPTTLVTMLSLFVTLGLAPMAWAVWTPPELFDVLALALVAVFATFGHWTMSKALAAAPIMVTQPVTFLQLVWATILGVVAFGEPADIFVLSGGAIIIAAVTFISYREWVLSRRAKTPPAVATRD